MDGFDWKSFLTRQRRGKEEEEDAADYCWQEVNSPYVCPRRDCRYYNEPHKGALHSCDYLEMTGRSRIAQIPQEKRLQFECCVCYEPAEKPARAHRSEDYEQKATYDWQEGRRRYAQGASDGDIAKALGCARSTVRYWRQRMRLPANTAGSRG